MTITDAKREMSLHDRCDACGAQAFVIATFLNGELMFCGHHYRRWKANIDASASQVDDRTDEINEKPSVSSY